MFVDEFRINQFCDRLFKVSRGISVSSWVDPNPTVGYDPLAEQSFAVDSFCFDLEAMI